ncbi:hypothetical protein ED28_10050 [[Pantoea] beijingensis]|uniref:Uncharacterized protein n=1 Tax=[Pantoea] beijingensis TaxID=1324864 RepID=A0A443ICX1_9GAMM|nr:hypothetical protein ED28_10050 [[Pantoea] beijingensis]
MSRGWLGLVTDFFQCISRTGRFLSGICAWGRSLTILLPSILDAIFCLRRRSNPGGLKCNVLLSVRHSGCCGSGCSQ